MQARPGNDNCVSQQGSSGPSDRSSLLYYIHFFRNLPVVHLTRNFPDVAKDWGSVRWVSHAGSTPALSSLSLKFLSIVAVKESSGMKSHHNHTRKGGSVDRLGACTTILREIATLKRKLDTR